MSEALLKYFLYNDEAYETSQFEEKFKAINPSLYEVIRIIDGVPIFLEEHYERFQNSFKILGFDDFISYEEMENQIIRIAKLNNIKNFNIKIVVNNLNSKDANTYYYFIEPSYPTDEMYGNGVHTILYSAERENPHAKVVNKSLREITNNLIKEQNCYEVLLVNNKNEITEGSRSNLFFIIGDKVYTSPAKDVLLGITRKRIMRLCSENGIEVIERPILVDELDKYDAAFVSGTSPKALPIATIDDIKLKVDNDCLRKIMKLYDDEIEKYMGKK